MWQLPNILTAKKGLFSADLKELLAAFKKEPGKYTYASAGFGTTLHLSGEMMNSMAGVQVRHVPYRGGAPALNDLLGGNVDMLFDNLPGSLPSVRSGAIRPVAVTAKKRLAELPDVPAMAELLPGYELTSWTALMGPGEYAARSRRADQRAHREGFRMTPGCNSAMPIWARLPGRPRRRRYRPIATVRKRGCCRS